MAGSLLQVRGDTAALAARRAAPSTAGSWCRVARGSGGAYSTSMCCCMPYRAFLDLLTGTVDHEIMKPTISDDGLRRLAIIYGHGGREHSTFE